MSSHASRTNGWSDLASNAPGITILHEAARRHRAEGEGADRPWRVGADGELAVAALLTELTGPSRRFRTPTWRVLHSIPVGARPRDIDHLLIGPPGVVTINTKHHRGGRLVVDGDAISIDDITTEYVARSREEAAVTRALLGAALRGGGHHRLAATLDVRSLIAVLGGLLHVVRWPAGVTVTTTTRLVHSLRTLPARIDPAAVEAVFEVARRSTTWQLSPGGSA
ncbi:nuclease-related domain-containing protein [Actinomycetes bacterium KLBMP 9759]